MALVDSFDILLDQPSSTVYHPGKTLTGRVLTKSYFERDVKGLNLTFHGRANVNWTKTVTKLVRDSDGFVVPETTKTTLTNSCNYFHFDRFLFGDGKNEMMFPSGENYYDFSFTIPPVALPASYSSTVGSVEYILEARLVSTGAYDQYKVRKIVKVSPLIDLSLDRTAVSPGEWELKKTYAFCCCYRLRELAIDVRTPNQGFCPGQTIDVTLEVDNMSHKKVNDICIDLIQEDTYLADEQTKSLRQKLARVNGAQTVRPETSRILHLPIKIPRSAPPTNLGQCEIIKVEYSLEIEVEVSHGSNLFRKIPIRLGTIPVRKDASAGELASAPPPLYQQLYPPLPGWNC